MGKKHSKSISFGHLNLELPFLTWQKCCRIVFCPILFQPPGGAMASCLHLYIIQGTGSFGRSRTNEPLRLHMTYMRNKKSLCPLEALKTQNELQYTGIQHWLLTLLIYLYRSGLLLLRSFIATAPNSIEKMLLPVRMRQSH